MKRFLLATACVLALGFRAPAQSVTVALDQLIALHTLGQTMDQGYTATTTGLNTIDGIRATEYQQHTNYFSSLDTVDTAVAADKKLEAIRTRLAQLIARLRSALDAGQ